MQRKKTIYSDLKQFFTYQHLLKSIIFLLLVGQLWSNVASLSHWVMDSEFELIELCDLEESESEEKEFDEKKKGDKFRDNLFVLEFNISASLMKISLSKDFSSIHQSKPPTPPPEFFLS